MFASFGYTYENFCNEILKRRPKILRVFLCFLILPGVIGAVAGNFLLRSRLKSFGFEYPKPPPERIESDPGYYYYFLSCISFSVLVLNAVFTICSIIPIMYFQSPARCLQRLFWIKYYMFLSVYHGWWTYRDYLNLSLL